MWTKAELESGRSARSGGLLEWDPLEPGVVPDNLAMEDFGELDLSQFLSGPQPGFPTKPATMAMAGFPWQAAGDVDFTLEAAYPQLLPPSSQPSHQPIVPSPNATVAEDQGEEPHRSPGSVSLHEQAPATAADSPSRPARPRTAPKRFSETGMENTLDSIPDDSESDLDSLHLDKSRAGRKRKRVSSYVEHDVEADSDDEDFEHDHEHLHEPLVIPNPETLSKEEHMLYRQLQRLIKDMEASSAQLNALSTAERKKLRNRKASRISRLKKKLSMFDLERRHTELLKKSSELEHTLASANSTLDATVRYIRERYEPSFQLQQSTAAAAAAAAQLPSKAPRRKR